jgi:ketosteroid isomerase-like protein
MSKYAQNIALGRKFHAALVAGDWDAIRALLTNDAKWILPGNNTISGPAVGADAVIARAKAIAAYRVNFELTDILVSRTDMALGLHNTAERTGVKLDERLATVCRVRDGKIAQIETFLSDVEGMDAFFTAGSDPGQTP